MRKTIVSAIMIGIFVLYCFLHTQANLAAIAPTATPTSRSSSSSTSAPTATASPGATSTSGRGFGHVFQIRALALQQASL